jgi:nuclear transport factor 2 (NTF2) superfamily protein
VHFLRQIEPAFGAPVRRLFNPSPTVEPAEMESRPPLPPFTLDTARQKARAAEDAWNTRDPVRVSLAYTPDSIWRNRAEFFSGRDAIVAFLQRKWARELDYRLIKEVWAFTDDRIAVRFAYEWRDDSGSWFRSYGNENWEFAPNGLMRRRIASINDLPISETERKYHWPLGRRGKASRDSRPSWTSSTSRRGPIRRRTFTR